MTERAFTQAELIKATSTMRDGGRYAEMINAVVAEIDRQEEAARILADKPSPTTVPKGFRQIAVCANGYNIGRYLFHDSDRHIWLPPEEAIKERPNLILGIWAEDIKQG